MNGSSLVGVLLVLCAAGCATIPGLRTEDRVSGSSGEESRHLVSIARQIGLRPSSGRSAADIATDIKLALDENVETVPQPLSDECAKELEKVLSESDRKLLQSGQRFLRKNGGRRFLILPKE